MCIIDQQSGPDLDQYTNKVFSLFDPKKLVDCATDQTGPKSMETSDE